MIPRSNLTPKQRQLLDFIQAELARVGALPSRAAMEAHLGISPPYVRMLVKDFREMGIFERLGVAG